MKIGICDSISVEYKKIYDNLAKFFIKGWEDGGSDPEMEKKIESFIDSALLDTKKETSR